MEQPLDVMFFYINAKHNLLSLEIIYEAHFMETWQISPYENNLFTNSCNSQLLCLKLVLQLSFARLEYNLQTCMFRRSTPRQCSLVHI